MTTLIGTASYQIPTNGDLGTMAFQDSTAISVGSISVGTGIPSLTANATTLFIGNSSVNATVNSTTFSGTSANATNLGGVPAASYVNTSGIYTISGIHTYTGGIAFANTITANGSNGTAGYVLTSSGSTGNVYWGAAGGATLSANNTDTQTFYPAMSNNTTGSWSNAVIATSKLYFVPSTGTLSATIFTTLSDRNAKTNIQPISGALDVLRRMEGVSFDWKDNNKKSYGVIAQDIEKLLPSLVEENSGIKSVNYLGIIGFLIEAVKELDARLNVLENR